MSLPSRRERRPKFAHADDVEHLSDRGIVRENVFVRYLKGVGIVIYEEERTSDVSGRSDDGLP